jgi:hypothetical protein
MVFSEGFEALGVEKKSKLTQKKLVLELKQFL